jgi:NAD(P)H dehydrogenase (quinone)
VTARIFVCLGHPSEASFADGVAGAYQRGAQAGGADIRRMHLSDMVFDPNLQDGYHSRKELEPRSKAGS